jgi:hypothetical protein
MGLAASGLEQAGKLLAAGAEGLGAGEGAGLAAAGLGLAAALAPFDLPVLGALGAAAAAGAAASWLWDYLNQPTTTAGKAYDPTDPSTWPVATTPGGLAYTVHLYARPPGAEGPWGWYSAGNHTFWSIPTPLVTGPGLLGYLAPGLPAGWHDGNAADHGQPVDWILPPPSTYLIELVNASPQGSEPAPVFGSGSAPVTTPQRADLGPIFPFDATAPFADALGQPAGALGNGQGDAIPAPAGSQPVAQNPPIPAGAVPQPAQATAGGGGGSAAISTGGALAWPGTVSGGKDVAAAGVGAGAGVFGPAVGAGASVAAVPLIGAAAGQATGTNIMTGAAVGAAAPAIPQTPAGTKDYGGTIVGNPAAAPRADLVAIAAEVGAIEEKVGAMLTKDVSNDFLQAILAALRAQVHGTTYRLHHACGSKPDGSPLDPVEVDIPLATDSNAAILFRLDALAELIDVQNGMKKLTCKGAPPVGEAVTVTFNEV